MQESSRRHDAELLFRTKDHGPSRLVGVVPDGLPDGVPDGVPDEPAGEVEGPEGADGADGAEGPDGPDAPHGAPPPAGGHGGFALGMFKNLVPAFGALGAPPAGSAPSGAPGEPPGLAMQSPLPLADPSPRIAPVTFVGNKYVLLDKVEGSSFFNCIDINTREQLVCKVVGREAGPLLSAHFRVDGHPGLNEVREVMLGHGHTYLVFPAAHGDLHTHVRTRKRLRDSEARRLFRQMAECVRHCHEAGIVLRDLKLRKFVFTDRQRTTLKLESLEDAVVLDSPEDDLLQDKRGCPAYVSPEILRSHAQYSGRAADMWSLGVILYTTLVGRYPFNDSEHASLFAKISRGHFVMPDWLSHKARCLIRSLLRRDPAERLTAEDVLRHPWLQQDRDRHGLGDDAAADLHHHHHHHHHGVSDSASDQLVPDVM